MLAVEQEMLSMRDLVSAISARNQTEINQNADQLRQTQASIHQQLDDYARQHAEADKTRDLRLRNEFVAETARLTKEKQKIARELLLVKQEPLRKAIDLQNAIDKADDVKADTTQKDMSDDGSDDDAWPLGEDRVPLLSLNSFLEHSRRAGARGSTAAGGRNANARLSTFIDGGHTPPVDRRLRDADRRSTRQPALPTLVDTKPDIKRPREDTPTAPAKRAAEMTPDPDVQVTGVLGAPAAFTRRMDAAMAAQGVLDVAGPTAPANGPAPPLPDAAPNDDRGFGQTGHRTKDGSYQKDSYCNVDIQPCTLSTKFRI
jgi:hypothetical protein